MENVIQELKAIMRDLIIEVGELKEKVAYLERNLDYAKKEEPISPKLDIQDLAIAGEGYNNLGGIYKRGYHVCPVAYGRIRDGECLFCLAFLEKE